MNITLELKGASGISARRDFEGPRVLIGREVPASDLRVDGPGETVSRTHAELELADGVWSVRDRGSRNGTFVNGVKVSDAERTPVYDGDQIRLGTAGPTIGVVAAGRQRAGVSGALAPTVFDDRLGSAPEVTRPESGASASSRVSSSRSLLGVILPIVAAVWLIWMIANAFQRSPTAPRPEQQRAAEAAPQPSREAGEPARPVPSQKATPVPIPASWEQLAPPTVAGYTKGLEGGVGIICPFTKPVSAQREVNYAAGRSRIQLTIIAFASADLAENCFRTAAMTMSGSRVLVGSLYVVQTAAGQPLGVKALWRSMTDEEKEQMPKPKIDNNVNMVIPHGEARTSKTVISGVLWRNGHVLFRVDALHDNDALAFAYGYAYGSPDETTLVPSAPRK